MYLSRNLKYLRKKSGFSQEYIANKFGYKSFTTIQKWETGISEPSFSIVNELCSLYNVSLEDIIYKDLSKNEISTEKKASLTEKENLLLNKYNKLNDIGQTEAIKRVSELTEIEKYTTKTVIHVMAAHNDDNSPEQIELMRKDLEEMDKW